MRPPPPPRLTAALGRAITPADVLHVHGSTVVVRRAPGELRAVCYPPPGDR